MQSQSWGAATRAPTEAQGRFCRHTKPRQHRLAAIGLSELLAGFTQEGHTGTLSIFTGAEQVELVLQRGQVFVLPRLDDPRLGESLEAVLQVVFWPEARYTFRLNELPPAFTHPQSHARIRIALPVERLILLAERRAAAWEPIRQVIQGEATVLRFADRKAPRRALRAVGQRAFLETIDGRRTFHELVERSGLSRLKAGLIVTRLLQAGLIVVRRSGSRRLKRPRAG